MLKKLYHKISNSILLYKYDRCLWKLPFYYIFVILDYILYIISPLEFNISRKRYCGDTYVVSNFGIFRNKFNYLLDYIRRTNRGDDIKKCPFFMLPLSDNMEIPIVSPSSISNLIKHREFRKIIPIMNIKPKIDKISDFLESCIERNILTLGPKIIPFKKFIWKQVDLDVPDDILIQINKPISIALSTLLSKYIPSKYVRTEQRKSSYSRLEEIFKSRYPSISGIVIYNCINGIENGSAAFIILIFITLRNIKNNNLVNIIRSELSNGNTDLLNRCIIDSTRFVTYHPGVSLLETLDEERELVVAGRCLKLKSGDNIMINIPVCLQDPEYFPKDFYPYHPNIELVRETTFNGIMDDNLDNRCCFFQNITPVLVTEIIKTLLLEYEWDSDNTNSIVTPFTKLQLKNIKKRQ